MSEGKMKKRVLGIFGITLMGLWSAAVSVTAAGEGEMAVFTMSEKGESRIQVAAGKPFAIRFSSSPGTGYSWEFVCPPDNELLEFLGEKVEEPERGRLGGQVIVIWTFQAQAAGETEISLKYVRPWEKEVPPAKKYVFYIQIR
jgi:inhibitor of cysteine peptidase